METPREIIISGAGLAGSLLAIALKKRGHHVTILEKRADMRKNLPSSAGRSINLIITAKGIEPLLELNLWEKVRAITLPVSGRMIHMATGELIYQPYGKDKTECNYSVSRSQLNILLINEAKAMGVNILFDTPLSDLDFKNKKAFSNHQIFPYDLFFGADGAGSTTRNLMIKKLENEASCKVEALGTDYKEMSMPASPDGASLMDKTALHIWPRGQHMLMALPNLDNTFTMTLYMPTSWYNKFDSEEKISNYFSENYPDAIKLMPDYLSEYTQNPQGFLGVVRMEPWIYEDHLLILGDAAHAIVPFFGQGMNSSFADVQYLIKQFDKNADDIQTIFSNYNSVQKKNGDAVAELSLDNFIEMCERVGDEKFLLKKKIENIIENTFPHKYRSRYAMVTYTLISYADALEGGKIQDKILNELIAQIHSPEELDLDLAERLIDKHFTPWIVAKKIKLQ